MSVEESNRAAEIAFFDAHYRDPTFHPTANRLRHVREVNWVKRLIRNRSVPHALSVGCGAGEFELLLAPFVGKITALDISPAAIEVARDAARARSIANVEFQCGTLDNLPAGAGFDLVACISFLHHLPASDLPRTLAGLFAIMRPGGVLCTQDPNRRGWLRSIGRRVLRKSYDAYHSPDERELDPRELKSQLQSAGFVDVRLGSLDSTLIPAMYLMPRGPSWPFYVFRAIDFAWTSTPFWRFASGFSISCRKPSSPPALAPRG